MLPAGPESDDPHAESPEAKRHADEDASCDAEHYEWNHERQDEEQHRQ
jgi:hypothetical protein